MVKARDPSSLDDSLKKLNLSSKELSTFEKAFKEPEFIKLFDDYIKEVSDPKVKEETEQYLRQLEAEGQVEQVYGKGVQLLAPTAEFAVKSKNKRDGAAAFINFCSCDKVARLQQKRITKPDGSSGTWVETPFQLGQVKRLAGKQGEAQLAWDVAVHPATIAGAMGSPGILGMLVESAMEKIESVGDYKLHRAFKPVKSKYKGGSPAVMAIRTGEGGEVVNGRLRPASSAAPGSGLLGAGGNTGGTGSDLISASSDQAGKAATAAAEKGGDAKRSAFSFGSKRKPEPAAAAAKGAAPAAPPPKSPRCPGYAHPSGEVTPRWQLVHRGEVDLGQAWGDAGRAIPLGGSVPKELVLRVELPGVHRAADIDLDWSQAQQLALQVAGRYLLRLQLPHPVDEARGGARFSRERQQLTLTLPVVPPQRPDLPPPAAAVHDAVAEAAEEQPGAGEQERGACVPSTASSCEQPEQPHGSGDAAAALGAQLTENQRRWAELHQGCGAAACTDQAAQQPSAGAEAPAAGGQEQAEAGAGQAAPQCAAEQEAAAAASAAGASAAAAAPAAVPPPVLKPRLRSALAHQLL